ncbi:DUF1492 domain-containing protein [Streptococcus parauberis]|uniref:DUF1492 domain-containing protein n=1 Tax=Streptococcus parauberis TaxID=1348 RepID=UPI00020CBBCA|nr:DUF1492 domain-containing protein [Streptococcus parauberis]AEF26253.1 hypothetical protein STP_1805 [Streptococcus parauberis KCTC 11537]QBX09797.1 hypothetical protein JavanS388_0008 [Streptococcus satellite phage Javan388]QBX10029.1 hypothetical protein JavanS404_0008 [Streptococcus satellite phage Javan404]QBX10131.1 hypothetical protein JavanS412_0007 [Streptococcus satellite phage Javan412]ONH63077.1 hypothetical protein ASN87_01542 [Streptococcus parauberis]
MTEDELKKELKKISGYDKMIKNLNLELQYIEDGIFSKSVLTNSKVKTSLSNRTENKVVDTLGMKDNILDQIQALIADRNKLIEYISLVDDPEERLILHSWYVLGKSWGEIADQFEISQAKIFSIKRRAIKSICERLNNIG